MPEKVNRWALRDMTMTNAQSVVAPNSSPAIGRPIGAATNLRSEEKMASIPQKTGGQWSPTVVHLAILIVLEIAAFAALRYAFRTAHGG